MGYVDFELIHEPGKDDADPLNFLSRHPLQEEGKDAVERVINYVLKAEHAVVVNKIKEKTHKDTQLQSKCSCKPTHSCRSSEIMRK